MNRENVIEIQKSQKETLDWLRRTLRLSKSAVRMLTHLVGETLEGDRGDTLVISYEEALKVLKVKSYTTISRVYKELCTKGLIQLERRQGRPNTVVLCHPFLAHETQIVTISIDKGPGIAQETPLKFPVATITDQQVHRDGQVLTLDAP